MDGCMHAWMEGRKEGRVLKRRDMERSGNALWPNNKPGAVFRASYLQKHINFFTS
jgi:hypothetical protein